MKKLLVKIGTTLLKLAAIAVAVFVLYKVATFAYGYGFRIFAEEPVDREPGIDVNVAVVEGKSVKEIGTLLKEKGLIRDATLFVLQEKFSEYAGDLKPGNYTLNTSQTPYEMMAIMSAETEVADVRTDTLAEKKSEAASEAESNMLQDELAVPIDESIMENGPDTLNTDGQSTEGAGN